MSGRRLLDLLPRLMFTQGEVERIGQYAVSSTATIDTWEGVYLGKVKVAIRSIRAVKCDEKTSRVSIAPLVAVGRQSYTSL
jgi:hypothetical protein